LAIPAAATAERTALQRCRTLSGRHLSNLGMEKEKEREKEREKGREKGRAMATAREMAKEMAKEIALDLCHTAQSRIHWQGLNSSLPSWHVDTSTHGHPYQERRHPLCSPKHPQSRPSSGRCLHNCRAHPPTLRLLCLRSRSCRSHLQRRFSPTEDGSLHWAGRCTGLSRSGIVPLLLTG